MLRPHTRGMERGTDRSRVAAFLSAAGRMLRELAGPGTLSPNGLSRGFVLLRRIAWRRLLLLVGFLVQAVLMWMLWQLVELCISLFEAWVILARHSLL